MVFGGILSAGSSGAGSIASAAAEANEKLEEARKNFEPFTKAGTTDIQGTASLITDPERQRQFIEENPFFNALADRARNDLLQRQATKGRLGTGETAEALQTSLLLLGNDLLNQDVQRRFGLANIGLSGASGEANALSGQASNLMTAGMAAADGKMFDAQSKANFFSQGVKSVGAFL